MKTNSTGSKKNRVKNSKPKARVVAKLPKKPARAESKSKSIVALSGVPASTSARVATTKTKIVAAKVSVAERLSASHLVKSEITPKTKSGKSNLTLVSKSGTKLPATKISRSEPVELGTKVITGRFSLETSPAKPMIAVKGVVEKVQTAVATVGEPSMFKVGDKIVYPGHGVGEIEGIRTTVLGGQEHHIYNIKILDSGMKVMVPVSQASSVGMRKIIDKKAIDEVFAILRDRDFKIDTQTWNRRFREYSQKIKTGSVFEIAIVLRDLSVLSADKELSFGEKKMLDMAESLLVSEIAIARARPHDKVVVELRELFA